MSDKKLTFIEHMEELRAGIIKSIVSIILASIAVYSFTDVIFSHLIKPVGLKLIFIAPQEAFVANIKIALFGGLYFASPFVLYQVWSFISQGLKREERFSVSLLAFLSFFFFISGSAFGYFVIVPIGFKFLLNFGVSYATPMISLGNYVSFVMLLTFAFGLAFELPLVILLLSEIGIVTHQSLSKNRKYAIVIIFIVAAIFTPPDVVTQCLLAVPLLFLYEVGILFSRLSRR